MNQPLTSEQDAIKQAGKAGYRHSWHSKGHEVFDGNDDSVKFACYYAHLLDPAFWQALGKARGWEDPTLHSVVPAFHFNGKTYGPWFSHASLYFQTRLSSGNLKKYWQSLP